MRHRRGNGIDRHVIGTNGNWTTSTLDCSSEPLSAGVGGGTSGSSVAGAASRRGRGAILHTCSYLYCCSRSTSSLVTILLRASLTFVAKYYREVYYIYYYQNGATCSCILAAGGDQQHAGMYPTTTRTVI